MRIGIIGAGAIGGTIAAQLDRGGHHVTVTARGAHLDAIRADGIRLSGGWGDHVALVGAGEVLVGDQDLVILTTKAQDAASALAANRAAVRGAPLLVVQNGLDGTTSAHGAGAATVTAGLSMVAASFLSPGLVEVTTTGATFLGGPGADWIAASIGDAVPVEVVDDIASAQWTKLFINQVNALPAITGLSVQQVAADPQLLRVLTASMRETVRVARANGVRFATIGIFDDDALEHLLQAPFDEAQELPRRQAVSIGDVPNPASTLQSIRRGQLTEIDHLNGAVVARAGDVPVPVNAALVELVHEIERGAPFLSAAQVAARVPSAEG